MLHLWEAGDQSWRERDSLDHPIRSGAESFIAGTASCRVAVKRSTRCTTSSGRVGICTPASSGGASETDYGTREFATLDLDGNLVTFFRWESES